MGTYDVAQYCRAGHEITQVLNGQPELGQRFCRICGAATLSACERCGAAFRGVWYSDITYGGATASEQPNHCHACGEQLPWVAEKLQAGRELIAMMDELSPDEQQQLSRSLDDIVRAGARTDVGVFRFKHLVAKARPASQKFLQRLFQDVASDGAKVLMGDGP